MRAVRRRPRAPLHRRRAAAGDETDIAHVLVSLTQGLAATEAAGWLGTSKASIDRRWALAVDAVLSGLAQA